MYDLRWRSCPDWKKVMLHISRSVSSFWTHLWCFHRSSWSMKSYCRKTAGDLSWPEMTLATWRGVTSHNLPTQGVNSTYNTMFESVSIGFRPKETPFIFFHGLIITERSQNSPDHGSPISKFRDIHFVDTITDINRWKISIADRSFGVALTSIQTFWGEVTWRATWPWVTRVWNVHMCGKDVSTLNRCAKNLRGVFKHPLARRGLISKGEMKVKSKKEN